MNADDKITFDCIFFVLVTLLHNDEHQMCSHPGSGTISCILIMIFTLAKAPINEKYKVKHFTFEKHILFLSLLNKGTNRPTYLLSNYTVEFITQISALIIFINFKRQPQSTSVRQRKKLKFLSLSYEHI